MSREFDSPYPHKKYTMAYILLLLSKIHPLVSIIIAASTVIVGDYFAKIWSLHTSETKYFILSVFFYGLSGVFFTPTLTKQGLVYASVIWTILSVTGFLFVGILLFKETLTFTQIIGILIGIISIVILTSSN